MHPKMPRHLPTWAVMVDSLGSPAPRQLAKWLGLSERTVWNYQRKGEAPRAVMLALFWLTPWGYSQLDCDRETAIQVLQSLSESLRNENAGLRLRIARLEQTGDFGAANEPVHAPHYAPRVTETLMESAPELGPRRAAGR